MGISEEQTPPELIPQYSTLDYTLTYQSAQGRFDQIQIKYDYQPILFLNFSINRR